MRVMDSGAERRHEEGRRLARMALLLTVGLSGLIGALAARAASMDPRLLPGIQAATFEVVAAKPAQDPLRYERPLPLDLLPYHERTDKYYSVGTAFAIGGGRYVTAGHVLIIGAGSLWGPPALRDAAGHVYAIDKVEKYSLERDFVVFTLAGHPGDAALAIDRDPAVNTTVYAVGNALGTGVVIRDGLYTSDTPEEQDGRWKWMRFSAAASPGNSGGPLLDQDGKVIGVVLAKSPNENLNYALPIRDVLDAPARVAEIGTRAGYQFDAFDSVLSNRFQTRFALPLPLADFFATYQQRWNTYCQSQLEALLAKEAGRTFPRGDGASELLHGVPSMRDFPSLIVRQSNGRWALSGNAGNDVALGANGHFTPGAYGNDMLFHLRRPDDVPAARLYADPTVLMDLVARVGFMTRTVGSETIKLTSLGKPTLDVAHVDTWQRSWRTLAWPLPYANAYVMLEALPVPDGYVGIMRYVPAAQAYDVRINLEALTDFMYVTYDGTLAQWRDYLKYAGALPAALQGVHVDFDYGQRFEYRSKHLRFAFTPELQRIEADSMLTLGFGFFQDHGKVTWDVADVWMAPNPHDKSAINIARNVAPSADLDDSYKDEWARIVQRQHPYDAVALSDSDVTKINSVVGASPDASPAVLYTAYYHREGTQPQEAMRAKLDMLLKNLQVVEH